MKDARTSWVLWPEGGEREGALGKKAFNLHLPSAVLHRVGFKKRGRVHGVVHAAAADEDNMFRPRLLSHLERRSDRIRVLGVVVDAHVVLLLQGCAFDVAPMDGHAEIAQLVEVHERLPHPFLVTPFSRDHAGNLLTMRGTQHDACGETGARFCEFA